MDDLKSFEQRQTETGDCDIASVPGRDSVKPVHVDFSDSVVFQKWLTSELHNFVRRFQRSFGKGLAVYAGVRLVTTFMKKPFRIGLAELRKVFVTSDCLRFATFVGLYPSLYNLLVATLRRYRRKKDGWNYGIAGCLAGLSLALEDQSRQKTFAIYSVSRALGAGLTTLASRGYVWTIPFGETLIYCLLATVIVNCAIQTPHLLPLGYYYSMIKWSRGYSHQILTQLFRSPGHKFISCQEVGLHAGSCESHALQDFFHNLPAFAKLYLPIYLLPLLIFKRKSLRKRPRQVILSLGKNLVRSTLFLSTMVLLAKYSLCFLRHASGHPPPLPTHISCASGFICGLAVLWEPVHRRKELLLFLIPQLINILLVVAGDSHAGQVLGNNAMVKRGFAMLFAAAMGVVMHSYEREPLSLTELMTSLLRFFWGCRWEEMGDRREGKRDFDL